LLINPTQNVNYSPLLAGGANRAMLADEAAQRELWQQTG